MIRDEGIAFEVCRNPDVKCAVVERAHRTIRNRIFRYFTFSNSHRYIDFLPKFVNAYNDIVHTTTAMAPSRVTDAEVLEIWLRMESRRPRVHNFSTKIFRIVNVIVRRPRAVYELEDLIGTPIVGQFYHEYLTSVRITSLTSYEIDKILDKGVIRCIREYHVRWRGYFRDFNSWIPASGVKYI
jgi:hypothetical protein